MADITNHAAEHHGDHDITFDFEPGISIESARALTKAKAAGTVSRISVIDVEQEAIARRRERIRDLAPDGNIHNSRKRDRTANPKTGIALSGGGIRSASFGLGVLQGLHVEVGIEGVDYLSTVSGGGFVGSALTASMQHTDGEFPFTYAKSWADTASVRHIRDYSNYLIPHGALDIITAAGIIMRGLVANAMIALPVIFALVWLTLIAHPNVESLGRPKILTWDLTTWLAPKGAAASAPRWGLRGFWFTIIILALDLIFLIVWVSAKSISSSQLWQRSAAGHRHVADSAELDGPLAKGWKILFFLTVFCAWCEAQPFILYYYHDAANTPPGVTGSCSSLQSVGPCFSALLHGWILGVTPWLAPLGAVIAFFSKYLAEIAAVAKRSHGPTAWIKSILAKGAIWLAAIIMPSFLWLLYLGLTSLGLEDRQGHSSIGAARWLADWMCWPGPTVAARLYFEAFVITLALALLVNPNVTSLYRLYRDRLSKAFLFNPDPTEPRDSHGDLIEVMPKLHELNTNLCPYPIINAALNIEGSQFVNKRGRNADFFMFTPEYTGSDATGYVGTERIEKDETALDLGTAMAISGAAISSNMGRETIKPLSPTLALLNIRLGYWLRNPLTVRKDRPWWQRVFDVRGFLLFKEMFSWITETSRTVYLTDGGNIENLGVYALMKRRCPFIIAVDAEADPTMSFPSFLLLERYARIDLGVTVDLPWQAIRKRTLLVDKALEPSNDKAKPLPVAAGPHCAAGEIAYGPGKTGILFYVKASLTGDESDYVLDYKRRNPDFPHETTGDQFFGEEQLEAYRALGFHIVSNVLNGAAPFAVKPHKGETEEQARNRILDALRQAMGVAAIAPTGH
jgi:hypothetical protein